MKFFKKSFTIFFLLVTCYASLTWAQSDVITSYGPNSITRNIIQDRNGHIWIASFNGIFRYDGKSFTNITSKVSSGRFFSVLEDRKGNLWFGSIGTGVYYYDGKSFQNFTTRDGLINNEITCIYEDKTGNIWFGAPDGLWRYAGSTFTNFTQQFVGYITEDKKGNIWTSSESDSGQGWALSRYDEKSLFNKKLTVTEITNKPMIFGILEDDKGNIWFGADGLYRYDGNTITDFKSKESQ